MEEIDLSLQVSDVDDDTTAPMEIAQDTHMATVTAAPTAATASSSSTSSPERDLNLLVKRSDAARAKSMEGMLAGGNARIVPFSERTDRYKVLFDLSTDIPVRHPGPLTKKGTGSPNSPVPYNYDTQWAMWRPDDATGERLYYEFDMNDPLEKRQWELLMFYNMTLNLRSSTYPVASQGFVAYDQANALLDAWREEMRSKSAAKVSVGSKRKKTQDVHDEKAIDFKGAEPSTKNKAKRIKNTSEPISASTKKKSKRDRKLAAEAAAGPANSTNEIMQLFASFAKRTKPLTSTGKHVRVAKVKELSDEDDDDDIPVVHKVSEHPGAESEPTSSSDNDTGDETIGLTPTDSWLKQRREQVEARLYALSSKKWEWAKIKSTASNLAVITTQLESFKRRLDHPEQISSSDVLGWTERIKQLVSIGVTASIQHVYLFSKKHRTLVHDLKTGATPGLLTPGGALDNAFRKLETLLVAANSKAVFTQVRLSSFGPANVLPQLQQLDLVMADILAAKEAEAADKIGSEKAAVTRKPQYQLTQQTIQSCVLVAVMKRVTEVLSDCGSATRYDFLESRTFDANEVYATQVLGINVDTIWSVLKHDLQTYHGNWITGFIQVQPPSVPGKRWDHLIAGVFRLEAYSVYMNNENSGVRGVDSLSGVSDFFSTTGDRQAYDSWITTWIAETCRACHFTAPDPVAPSTPPTVMPASKSKKLAPSKKLKTPHVSLQAEVATLTLLFGAICCQGKQTINRVKDM